MVFDQAARDLIADKCLSNGFTPELIMSDALEAGALTQILLRPELEEVFNTLLSASGVELRIKPLTTFIPSGEFKGDVRELQQVTAKYGEIALGVLTQESDAKHLYSIQLNPPAGQQLDLGKGSRVVVLQPG